jgi:hypothetical protein
MRYHILNKKDNTLKYSFSVEVYDEDQLVKYLLAKWFLSNETEHLEKLVNLATTHEVYNVLQSVDEGVSSCIITQDSDYDDYIEAEGGLHIFQPMGWNIPTDDELVELKNKYTDIIKFWYHPKTKSYWLDARSKSNRTCMIRIMDINTIRLHKFDEQVAAMGI